MSDLRDLVNDLFVQGRYDLAEERLREAITQHPAELEWHALLAACLSNQDRLDEADDVLSDVLRQDPEYGYAHYVQSGILWQQGRLENAEAAAREAIRLVPDHAPFLIRLGRLESAQDRLEDAWATSSRALALDPHSLPAHKFQVESCLELGRHEDALAAVQRALTLAPDDGEVHALAGQAAREAGRSEDALAHYLTALRARPNDVEVHDGLLDSLQTRSWLYRFVLGHLLRAIEWAERVTPSAILDKHPNGAMAAMIAVVVAASLLGQWVGGDEGADVVQMVLILAALVPVGLMWASAVTHGVISFFLQFNPIARHLIPTWRKVFGNMVAFGLAGLMLVMLAIPVAMMVQVRQVIWITILFVMGVNLPAAVAFAEPSRTRRRVQSVYVLVIGAVLVGVGWWMRNASVNHALSMGTVLIVAAMIVPVCVLDRRLKAENVVE